MEVPRRLAVFFENFGIFAPGIVFDHEGDEIRFDGFDDEGICEDFGPEDAATVSSRDFLEEKEDGFAGFFGKGERFIMIT